MDGFPGIHPSLLLLLGPVRGVHYRHVTNVTLFAIKNSSLIKLEFNIYYRAIFEIKFKVAIFIYFCVDDC